MLTIILLSILTIVGFGGGWLIDKYTYADGWAFGFVLLLAPAFSLSVASSPPCACSSTLTSDLMPPSTSMKPPYR